MYLVRQIIENTDRVVSGLILTKVLLRSLEFLIELYLVRQIPKDTKGNTWISTDLKGLIGVRHVQHYFFEFYTKSSHFILTSFNRENIR